MIQSDPKTQVWNEDLVVLGYGPPLPAPIPAVQATLTAIDIPEFHTFIQETDTVTINEADDEGLHTPLLIDSLDLAAWTSLFVLATTDKTKTVDRLRKAHGKLPELLVEDEQEADRAELLAQKVEAVLKLANEDALGSDAARTLTGPEATPGTDTHPLLAKLKISSTDRSALEGFSEVIQTSQAEKQKQHVVSSKGPVVPIRPSRSVELLVAEYQHRMWAVGNTNLLSPISIPMWKAWTGLSDSEVESYKKQAMNNIGVLRAPMDLLHAFPLAMYDHSKCTTLEVKLHTKQDLPTGHNRKDSHMAEMWNVQRPYLRCLCNPRASSGCKGSIIWFDHAIWTMVNKLEVFFHSYPTSIARFAAFLVWMRESARTAVKAAIVFQTGREHMIRAAIQLSENPQQRLLTDIADTPLANKIERLIKGPKFSLSHPGSPSVAPSPHKKQRLNLNSSPADRPFTGSRGRNGPGSRGSPGRGGRASRGRGGGRTAWRNPSSSTDHLSGPTGVGNSPTGNHSHLSTGDAGTAGVADPNTPTQSQPARLFSPLKARVLLWEDEI